MLRFATLLFLVLGSPARAEAELVMFEQDGCHWCERWMEEVGTIYPKTGESRAAPLRMVDIHDPVPGDMELERAVVFTPTFVLVIDGKETGRMEGYAGDDFFWALLNELMERAGLEPAPAG